MRSEGSADRDPLVRQLREQISDNDRAIVEGINKRLKIFGANQSGVRTQP